MFSNSLLGITSISQWALFLGIALVLYGWMEKNDKFIWGGHFVFLLLGLLSWYLLLSDFIVVPTTSGDILPKEAKVFAYFKGVALFSVLNIVVAMVRLFKWRFQKLTLFLLALFALMLFFMVYNIQKVG